MNKQKHNTLWRILFVCVALLYLCAILVLGSAIINIPNQYVKEQKKHSIEIQNKIEKALYNNDKKELLKIKQKEPVEFAVVNKKTDEIYYSTIKVDNILELRNSLNKNAISFEKYFSYETNSGNYNVWLTQYYISPQKVFNYWFSMLLIVIIVLVTINIIALLILYRKFLYPLNKLKDNIVKISKYQLDLVNDESNTEYGELSKQLVYFAKDLEEYIEQSTYTYTSLEKNLQLKNETLEYRNRMVASLTHDLKTPMTNINIKFEEFKNQYNLPVEIGQEIKNMQDKIDKLIDSVNEIGKVVYQDNVSISSKKEEFDLVALFLETIDLFRPQLNQKNISLEIVADEKIIIYENRLSYKQLIHNALSNLCSYCLENGEAEVNCIVEDNKIYLTFYNDAKNISEDDIDNIFKLFYRIGNEDKKGLGTGLFTIKRLSEELGGNVSFKNKSNGVLLEYWIDINE